MINRIGFRGGAACLAALSAGLSIAIISISKVLLVIGALIVLLRGEQQLTGKSALQDLWTPRLVLWVLLAFSLSLFWTSAPLSNALGAMGKYGKLLVIPAFLVMIRTQREAVWVLSAFLVGQIFIIVSSWLLYFHVPLLWATSDMATSRYAVFSSYLDQGIMSGTVAAIFWHLRTLAPSRFLQLVAVGLSLLALGGVFVVFVGRSGYLVGVAMVSLAFLWALPRRFRFAAMVMPPLIIVLSLLSFENVAQRFAFTKAEISAYSAGSGAATSTDNRLDFWRGSVEAIVQKPLAGAGVGSWTTEYNWIEALKHPGHKDLNPGGNPHHEYLLWGVQLGMGGILLLLALLSAVVLDFLKMETPVARAGQSVVLALAVSCLFNSSIFDAYIGDFFCLSIGVLLAHGVRSRHSLAPPNDSERPVKLQTSS